MKKSSRLMTVLGIGGLVAGSLLTASSASAGSSGASPAASVVAERHLMTSQDVVRQTSAAVLLNAAGGVPTTVLSETVPAGSWVLSSNATLVSWEPSDYTRCTLYAGETVVGGAASMIGNASTGAGSGVFAATVAAHGAFSGTGPTTVSLRCGHDTTRNRAPYVDPGATLWLHRSDGPGQLKR
ncbi:hypothetical protein [Streptomyces albireticuli]|uniref:Uncharacterized protein n=1 Tax=Streptomyces albireticuli TaxID=1940 RepID=A0A2A2D188_9ACTN|nr:hypothetical protein [Streptomyces albireticuli]MCD9145705.1 hypothetical protein [Streptomyces albireticuli]MCD9165563.1 hypothetical protein [Streptomyces albireticuli]MCD9195914.1 hypothetical protein [Streptomyces albireticuli]PAU45092.1 hypothetical protein CK936_31440 [Streptomyces albireticuli]